MRPPPLPLAAGHPPFRPCRIAHDVHTPGLAALRIAASDPSATTGPRLGARREHEGGDFGDPEPAERGSGPTPPPRTPAGGRGCAHHVQSRRFAGVGSAGLTDYEEVARKLADRFGFKIVTITLRGDLSSSETSGRRSRTQMMRSSETAVTTSRSLTELGAATHMPPASPMASSRPTWPGGCGMETPSVPSSRRRGATSAGRRGTRSRL